MFNNITTIKEFDEAVILLTGDKSFEVGKRSPKLIMEDLKDINVIIYNNEGEICINDHEQIGFFDKRNFG